MVVGFDTILDIGHVSRIRAPYRTETDGEKKTDEH